MIPCPPGTNEQHDNGKLVHLQREVGLEITPAGIQVKYVLIPGI